MSTYILYHSATGAIADAGHASAEELVRQIIPEGMARIVFLADLPPPAPATHFVRLADETIAAYTPEQIAAKRDVPPIGFVWNVQEGRFEDTRERAEVEQVVWSRIKAERDRRKSLGVQVGDYWFHSDADSRIQQMGLVMMGAAIPPGLMWKTMSGAFVEMTPALAAQIFQATAGHDQALFAVAEHHRAALAASADPASYDFSTGWPAAYGDA